jgi:hypothetical protein
LKVEEMRGEWGVQRSSSGEVEKRQGSFHFNRGMREKGTCNCGEKRYAAEFGAARWSSSVGMRYEDQEQKKQIPRANAALGMASVGMVAQSVRVSL